MRNEAWSWTIEGEQEPNIIKIQTEHVIKYFKSNKAPDPDVSAEMLQALGNNGVDIILNLYNKI